MSAGDRTALRAGATCGGERAGTAGKLRAARLRAIKQDVERWLDRPDLSVVALADRMVPPGDSISQCVPPISEVCSHSELSVSTA